MHPRRFTGIPTRPPKRPVYTSNVRNYTVGRKCASLINLKSKAVEQTSHHAYVVGEPIPNQNLLRSGSCLFLWLLWLVVQRAAGWDVHTGETQQRSKGMSCVRVRPPPPFHMLGAGLARGTAGLRSRVTGDPVTDRRYQAACMFRQNRRAGKKTHRHLADTTTFCRVFCVLVSEKKGGLGYLSVSASDISRSALSPEPTGRPRGGNRTEIGSEKEKVGYPTETCVWFNHLCVSLCPSGSDTRARFVDLLALRSRHTCLLCAPLCARSTPRRELLLAAQSSGARERDTEGYLRLSPPVTSYRV